MKTIIHNARLLERTLQRLIQASLGLPLGQTPWRITSVKRDGNVHINFKSTDGVAATELADRFDQVIKTQGYECSRIDEVKFHFPLKQLAVSENSSPMR